MSIRSDCFHFDGSKPCALTRSKCDSSCTSFRKKGPSILLIHLGALGAVVRSTGLLPLIQSQYPSCQITWVTDPGASKILKGHPRIHRLLSVTLEDMLKLSSLEFDVAFVVDKDLISSGVLKQTQAKKVFGFISDTTGGILPANKSAQELWELGLDDDKKFFQNQKSEIQLLAETFELSAKPQRYDLPLSNPEEQLVQNRYWDWSLRGEKKVIGINTGCAATLPAKKLSVQNHIDLIALIHKKIPGGQVVLLGGPEDTARNLEISQKTNTLLSPTQMGLRDGLASVAACDVVITGDSLGMHMAISQQVPVVVWFGPSCSQEIELFGRGQKILTQAKCSPCWKRSCNQPVMCYDLVDLNQVVEATNQQIQLTELYRADGLPRRSFADGSTAQLVEKDGP